MGITQPRKNLLSTQESMSLNEMGIEMTTFLQRVTPPCVLIDIAESP